jgi:hypothetical protein
MYQNRKVISVCIDLALFIEVYVPSQEKLIPFLAGYMYFNENDMIDTHTDPFPGLVHVLQ